MQGRKGVDQKVLTCRKTDLGGRCWWCSALVSVLFVSAYRVQVCSHVRIHQPRRESLHVQLALLLWVLALLVRPFGCFKTSWICFGLATSKPSEPSSKVIWLVDFRRCKLSHQMSAVPNLCCIITWLRRLVDFLYPVARPAITIFGHVNYRLAVMPCLSLL